MEKVGRIDNDEMGAVEVKDICKATHRPRTLSTN